MSDWTRLAGMRCSCPPGCTEGDTWGDGRARTAIPSANRAD